MTQTRDDERRQLDSVRRDLEREFAGRTSPEVVAARFDAVVAGFADAPVRTYVPVLARRTARQQLSSPS